MGFHTTEFLILYRLYVKNIWENYYDAKKAKSDLTWEAWLKSVNGDTTVPAPTEEDKVLKVKQNKLADVVLLTKAVTFNAGVTYEVYRSDLRAMERAKKQL